MSSPKYSTIEILPNELWLNIFQYFNTDDLFRTFFKLNKRIDNLVTSENNLHLTLNNNFDYERCMDIILNSIKSLSQVKSLTLQYSTLLEKFYAIYPITHFTQLHTLHLLSSIKLDIFRDILCLTTLKSLSLVYNSVQSFETQWETLCNEGSNLALTLIDFAVRLDFSEVVQLNTESVAQPNMIERFTMQFFSNRRSTLILPFFAQTQFLIFGHLPSRTQSCLVLNRCIKIKLDLCKDVTHEQIQSILKLVPQLKYLIVLQTDYSVQAAGRVWQHLLENTCKNVLIFNLTIRFTKGYGCPEYPLSYWNQNSFRTIYWVERKTRSRFRDHAFPGFTACFDIRKK
ncbi:unnamed protein product [Adineta ricciae]|uniref:F-box domain-containing protein n=1 Tax=Adineta ricciae TaxID=249248 RepID=A0A815SA24_ADIRI|nr:unnamed protein product [Adineta ricciae]CAF1573941.1 unnamed protein product [Adineta ricciae]